jgi:hypothetical protein
MVTRIRGYVTGLPKDASLTDAFYAHLDINNIEPGVRAITVLED